MTAARGSRTRERQLRRQLTALRGEWKQWNSGAMLYLTGWWGLPWCEHRHSTPGCEGCPTRMLCRDRAAEVAARAEELRLELEGPAEGELLTLTSRGWVTV